MCGITGTYGVKGNAPDLDVLNQSLQAIYHRGPDGYSRPDGE